MVLLPALEGDVIVLHPLGEAVRSGADREELRVLFLERLLVHDLGGLGEHGQERAAGPTQMEARLVLADGLHALDRSEENAHRKLVLRIEDAGKREGDVLRRERLAVVEYGVVDEVEEPGLVVLLLPGFREARDELARLV